MSLLHMTKSVFVFLGGEHYRDFGLALGDVAVVGDARVDSNPDVVDKNSRQQHYHGVHSASVGCGNRAYKEYVCERARRGGVYAVPDSRVFHGALVLDAENGVGRKVGQEVRQHAERYAHQHADERNVVEVGEHKRNVVLARRGNDKPAHVDEVDDVHYERRDENNHEVASDVAAVAQNPRNRDDRERNNAEQTYEIELPHVEFELDGARQRVVHLKRSLDEALRNRYQAYRQDVDEQRD